MKQNGRFHRFRYTLRQMFKVVPLLLIAAGLCATLAFQNCAKNGALFDEPAEQFLLKNDSVGCVQPWDIDGPKVAEGSYLMTFDSPSVAEGQVCVAQKSNCSGGKLFGDFTYPSCSILPQNAADCASPYSGGAIVRSGQSVTAYSVNAAGSCMASQRTCTNGSLTGKGNLPQCPNTSTCRTPWGYQLGEGEFYSARGPGGMPADIRKCGYDVFTYSCADSVLKLAKTRTNCNPNEKSCAHSSGTIVEHGTTMKVFNENVKMPGNCNAAGNTGVVSCNNGVLSGATNFKYQACYEDRNPCAAPWPGQSVPHDMYVIVFKAPTPGENGRCETNYRTCVNGELLGYNGLFYTYPHCVDTSL